MAASIAAAGAPTAGPCPIARIGGSSARSARADSTTSSASWVPIRRQRKRLEQVVEDLDRRSWRSGRRDDVRSRVSRNAMCPGVWPRDGITSRLPIRSPPVRRGCRPGLQPSLATSRASFPSDDGLAGVNARVELAQIDLHPISQLCA